MAVFKAFDWDKSVRDKGKNKLELKKVNVIYGRNYSGKTTLSRIVRSLETFNISNKYTDASFAIEIEGDGTVFSKNLNAHSQTVRVFNEDFVKENLRFLLNEDEDVQSFAILGDKNIEIETEIKTKEVELGTEEPPAGLLGQQKNKQLIFTNANNAVVGKQQDLEDLLRKKANNEIKINPDYKDVNYNIKKIHDDITTIKSLSFKDIDPNEVPRLKDLLKDEPKRTIPEIPAKPSYFPNFIKEVKSLVEKKITLSNPIKTLLEDSLLEAWVRAGITHHKDKRTTCGFCGNDLPPDLMKNLDQHFNKESEGLRSELEASILLIDEKSKAAVNFLAFDAAQFYALEKDSIQDLEKKYKVYVSDYQIELNKLINQLKERLGSISVPRVFVECTDISTRLGDIITAYNKIIEQTNAKTSTLSKSQDEARKKLRLHEVSTFLDTINYADKIIKIGELDKVKVAADSALKAAQVLVSKCKSTIDDLKTQLKDEKKGADQVNKYLCNYFGHDAIRLEPIGIESENGKFKFEIQRSGKKAFHMSEGECSLVSFCYFMAKLNDVNTKGNDPIIWIDDPVSSLDANHVFFIYSLINGEIVKSNKFKQLFISTHSLDFLKYLKRLKISGKETLNLLVQRYGDESTVVEMPDYMSKYVTEFNYLFHQIYKCANIDITKPESSLVFYDFGNNARKYLELLLAFKFPNPNKNSDEKLECFLGESCVESLLIDRINNEYSHLWGVFERGIIPIDVPEMKMAAQFILNKTYEHDCNQFNALMESIGEPPRP
jgi:wobble nucleotide-excising tRNase